MCSRAAAARRRSLAQLAGFEGVLQVDGYAAYASLAGDNEDVGQNPAGVLPRSRAPQLREGPQDDELALREEVIARIAAVYAIEERIRGLDADDRRAVRQAETKPLMEALKARLKRRRTAYRANRR